jgi:hypothetical protein
MPARRLSALTALIVAAHASTAYAGMPAPLPLEVPRVLQLSTPALERFQTISFFLFVFAGCAAVVMLLWNYVQRDFPRLPRLSFGRAAAGVFLWGLLFVIVLTMISGARELMTPRAWEQRGYTYQLAEPPATNVAAPSKDETLIEAPDLTSTSSQEGSDP